MNITRFSKDILRFSKLTCLKRLSVLTPAVLRLQQNVNFATRRRFSVFSKSPEYSEVPLMDLVTFESVCGDTIESLTDYFEELVEADPKLAKADIAYSVSQEIVV